MGVVYEARQRSLNRPVALKMILSGQLASAEEVARFRREAEAAAQLEHPGIVPIYEIGTDGDQHFFSMAFVEGESLAKKMTNGPMPPREAARLVKTIAEAVEYAHQKGIIHRDLKPANILLDRNGIPRITDFGLAKNIQCDSGMTATGQVMGTPSYMPPEQAAGHTTQVKEAADVYSLGAVLYALLTGRPPFQADNVLDTLRQVLEREPVPPQQLNPTIPQDLETICLKCLQKETRKRYQRAQEFADDARSSRLQAMESESSIWTLFKCSNRTLFRVIGPGLRAIPTDDFLPSGALGQKPSKSGMQIEELSLRRCRDMTGLSIRSTSVLMGRNGCPRTATVPFISGTCAGSDSSGGGTVIRAEFCPSRLARRTMLWPASVAAVR